MWNYIVLFFKTCYNTPMSRPKSVKYGSGEVLLKNLTDEEKKQVEKLLLGPETVVEIVETEQGFELKESAPETPMTHTAMSIVKIGNMWNLVTIPFNHEAKVCGEMTLAALHTNKNIAMSNFSVKQMKVLPR